MFFDKKKDDIDINELKKAIHDVPEEPFQPSSERKPYQTPQGGPPSAPTPRPARQDGQIAPLFVKVDKYRDILVNLQELRTLVNGTKQIFAVLNDIETTRAESLKLLRATVQRMERNLAELDNSLLRPPGLLGETAAGPDTGHIEESLTDLQKQLSSLHGQLNEFR